MNFDVTHEPGPRMGEFVLQHDGKRVGRMNYARQDQRIEILHTEVDPAMRGQHLGRRLVEAAVDWARVEGMQIVPLCAYAKAIFAKVPEFGDVLRQPR
jgi:uncharacterized protein